MKKIREKLQTQQNDCGPCCLAMILDYLGRDVELSELYQYKNTAVGWSMGDIKNVAKQFGVDAVVLRVDDMRGMSSIVLPAILFWDFSHFVVLEKYNELEATILDPNYGRKTLNKDTFITFFSGYCMELKPNQSFIKRKLSIINKISRIRNTKIWNFELGKTYSIALASYNIFLLMTPILISKLINNLSTREINIHRVFFLIGVICLTAVLNYILEKLRSQKTIILEEKSTVNIYEKLFSLTESEIARYYSGDIMSRISLNPQICRFLAVEVPNMIISTMLIFLASLYLILNAGIYASMIILLILLIAIINCIFITDLIKLSKNESYKRSIFRSVASDGILAYNFLIGSGITHRYLKKIKSSLLDYVQSQIDRGIAEAKSVTFQQTTSTFFSLLISIVSLVIVILSPEKSGEVALISSMAMILYSPMMGIVSSLINAASLYPNIERLIDLVGEEQPPKTFAKLQNGIVDVDELSYRYDNNSAYLFKNLSFSLEDGDTLFITGKSGSGKTSLVKILLGLQSISGAGNEGRITIGGVNSLSQKLDLRRDVCYISHPSILFKGTLKSNLKLFCPNYTVEELMLAIDKLNLSDVFSHALNIENLFILENGTNFSTGQRQRIGMIRLFLQEYKVIILDEPTSNMDSENAKAIMAAIDGLGATKIIITHDKELIKPGSKLLELGVEENGYTFKSYK
ncbi:cysteine peptidase family C39 domain-containing protein [Streptococcus ruminantium]|uniref:cysteine peptidase family C39 domain-containing protein n=1 Tax=Streptococcus ruminantium TaxID=1917441 RepID=UPI0012DECA63|nr:cysteine peptidase family C39 domain-containing protein [Streptococcus ruminantium]